MAPLRFKLKHRWVSPYALAPWQPDEVDVSMPAVLRVLRGGFFCLPLGFSKSVADLHGEPANAAWQLQARNVRGLELFLQAEQPQCEITKRIHLEAGHRAVYQEHRIAGLQGKYNYGQQTMLQFPKSGKCYLNTSAFQWGQVYPGSFANPALGEYSSLKAGARFEDLAKVPLANGELASLHEFPAREGYDDLVMVTGMPSTWAWTAVTLDGYIWFSLKKVAMLPSTLLWFSHGGRHNAPWHSRHRFRVAVYDVNSHFTDGLEVSRKNKLNAQGLDTAYRFNRRKESCLRIIQAVHPVSKSFGRVISIDPVEGAAEVVVTGDRGERVTVPVAWDWLAAKP